ncbi:MAG: zf-HC2 domain-containing protein [candidate division Zixibacteria bacterium]|nr:zf-HC2 domain-containing protein [candidate division Zixibacteria bacterium]
MTCQEALKLLYEVIDKEADQIDTEKVKEHLQNCKHCMARYEFEAMFKAFITEKAVSKCKTEQLKNRILMQIDKAGKDPKRSRFNPFRNKWRFLSALRFWRRE